MYNQWGQPWQQNIGYQGMNSGQQMAYPQVSQQSGYNWQWQPPPQYGQQMPPQLIHQQYYGNANQPSGQAIVAADINPPPPLEEPPKLRPPEPTEDDSAVITSEPPKSFKPKDSMEQERLNQLQQQAQQWQVQTRQWQEYQQSFVQSWQQTQQQQIVMTLQMQNWMRPEMEGIALTNKEEEEFELQWKTYSDQFNRWKEDNQNHPNQEGFRQYLTQWHQWQQQMELIREEVRKFRPKIEQKPHIEQTLVTSVLATATIPPPFHLPPLQQQQSVESSVLLENQPVNQRQQKEQQQSVEPSVLITHQTSTLQDNQQQLPQQNNQDKKMVGYQEFRNENSNESQLNSDLMKENVKTQYFNRLSPVNPSLGQPPIDQPSNIPSDQSVLDPPHPPFQTLSQHESGRSFDETFNPRRDELHDDPRGFSSDNMSRDNFGDRNQNFSGLNEEHGFNKPKPVQLFSGFQRPSRPFGTRYQQHEEKPFGSRLQEQENEPFGESDNPYDDYQGNSRFSRSERLGFGNSHDQVGSKDNYNENKIGKFGSSNDGIDNERNNFGSRDLFQDSRDNFGGSRDQFGKPQGFDGPRSQLTDSRNQFGSSREPFDGQRDPFSGPRDKFSDSKELLGGFKDNFDDPKDQFGGSRDRFGGSRDQFGSIGDRFGGPRDQFGNPREHFDDSKDRFGVPKGDFKNQRDLDEDPTDQFCGPKHNLGDYRDQPGGPRDKFGNFRDHSDSTQDHFDKDVIGPRDQDIFPNQFTGLIDTFGRPIEESTGSRDPFGVNRDRVNSRDRFDSRDQSRDRFDARERVNSREQYSSSDQVNMSISPREPKDLANIPKDFFVSRDASNSRNQNEIPRDRFCGIEGPNDPAYFPKDAVSTGSRDSVSSREQFFNSRDSLNSRELVGGPRDQFGGPRDQFGGPRDQFGVPRDQFGVPRDRFGGPRDQFGGPRDQFGGPRDQFGGPRDQFGGHRDQFGGPRDQFGGPRDQLGGPRDHFGSLHDKIGGSREQVNTPRDQFGRSRNDQEFEGRDDKFDNSEQFGSSKDPFGAFGRPRNRFNGPRDNFEDSRDQSGITRDQFSDTQDQFNRLRGQSDGPRDHLAVPGPRDQFQRSNTSNDRKPLLDKPKPLMSIPIPPQSVQKSLLENPKPLLEKSNPLLEKPKPLLEKSKPILETPKTLLQTPNSRFDASQSLLENTQSLSDTSKKIVEAPDPLLKNPKSSLNSQKPLNQSSGEQGSRGAIVRRRFPFEPKVDAFGANSIMPKPSENSKQSNIMPKGIKTNSNRDSVPKDKSDNFTKLETNKNQSNQNLKQVQLQEKPKIAKETLQSDSKLSENQPKEEKKNESGKSWEENQVKRIKLEEPNKKEQPEKPFQQQQVLPHDQQNQQVKPWLLEHREQTPLKPWQQKQLQHEQQKALQRKKWDPLKPWQQDETRPWQPEHMNVPPRQWDENIQEHHDQQMKPWQHDQPLKPWQRERDERLKPLPQKREDPGNSWDQSIDPINKPWQKQHIPPPPAQQWKNWQENKENPEGSRLEPLEGARDEKFAAGRELPPPRHFDRKIFDYDKAPYPYDDYDDLHRERLGRPRERFDYGDWKDDRLMRPPFNKDFGPDFHDDRRRLDYIDRERFPHRPYSHPDIGRSRIGDDRRFDDRHREILPTTTIDYGHRPPPKDPELLPRYPAIGGILSQAQKVEAFDYGHGQHAPLSSELKVSEFLREKEKEKANMEPVQTVLPVREIAGDKVIFDYAKERSGRQIDSDPTPHDSKKEQLFPQSLDIKEQRFPHSRDTKDQLFPQSRDTSNEPFPQSRETRDLFNREKFKGSDLDRENFNKGQTDNKSDRRPGDIDTKIDIDPKYKRVETKPETVLIEDLLNFPGRQNRPSRIVVIIRGPPGAGKTFVAKLIKDKEVENGGSAPRMLCLDDYFMVEVERTVADSETGKKVKKKILEYEYEAEMEHSYRGSLFKTFKKTVEDGFFPFIIVDAVNNRIRHFNEFWSFAKQKGFQVYIVELTGDASAFSKRNTHNRTMADITKLINTWEPTPRHHLRLDVRSLLQDAAIPEVEMEDFVVEDANKNKPEKKSKEINEVLLPEGVVVKSRWEQFEASEERLDKLDGIRSHKRKREPSPQRLEDYLQLPDDYEFRQSKPGQKRVRWADIEERKDQEKKRAMGFVIGQTDWAKMTDDFHPERCLKQTKYI